MNYPIYMDYNATTPTDPQVLEAMLPYFTVHFGNASSRSHAFGWKAAEAVEEAREKVANLIGANAKEIVFTSGATESINLAIKGIFEANQGKENHIITVATEHKAVLDVCHHLEKQGAKITYLPVDTSGVVSLEEIENAIKPTTRLISVMAANNETGVLQPLKKIANIARKNNVLFHCDATQAIGKIPLNIIDEGIDLLSFSGHKIYAPKGIGALFVRKKTPIIAQQDGGKHERGMRSGTLNVAGIVALGKAAEISAQLLDSEAVRIEILRNKLESGILKKVGNTQINGNQSLRLPNTTNISFENIDGETLLMNLQEIAVSNGSACNAASTEPSYVLKAMGLSDDLAYSSLRFSLGRFTQDNDIDIAIRHISEVVAKLRS